MVSPCSIARSFGFRDFGLLLLFPAEFYYVIVHVRNFERHMQFADRCAPFKIASSVENSVLLALQFQEANFRRILSGGKDINIYRSNYGFIKNKFNINA
jgi:hypothetical protein